jgi:hypothetical protein
MRVGLKRLIDIKKLECFQYNADINYIPYEVFSCLNS